MLCYPLDGGHRWGSYLVTGGRFGMVQRNLVIYPPGTGRAERRWLRLWRGGAPIGILAAALVMLGFGDALPIAASLSFSAVIVGSALALLGYRVRGTRGQVRSLLAIRTARQHDLASHTRYTGARRLAELMTEADELLAAGDIDEIEYQLRWHTAYAELGELLRSEAVEIR